MQIIKPDTKDQVRTYNKSIFLAGSIEMGSAENWQETVQNALVELPVTIYNPRRDNWDSKWEQSINNPEFNYQVNWELDKISEASLIFMYLAPGTKSPISLLELGSCYHKNIIVCCPEGYWRKGNVDIFCDRNQIPLYNNLDLAIRDILIWL